jgi:hypothetical protein
MRKQYSGLDVESFISHFQAGVAPTFKEAASIIRLCHKAVEHYDRHLLARLPIERYIKDSVIKLLSEDGHSLSHSINRIWNNPKRDNKSLRLLRLAGVTEVKGDKKGTVMGREVPDSFVTKFRSLDANEVEAFLTHD